MAKEEEIAEESKEAVGNGIVKEQQRNNESSESSNYDDNELPFEIASKFNMFSKNPLMSN